MKTLMASVAAAALLTGSALAQEAVDPTLPQDPAGAPIVQEDQAQTAAVPADMDFIQQQGDGELLATNWMGQEVYGADGEQVGTVDDLILTDEGKVNGVVIGVGGFLGIGEKEVALDLDSLEMSNDPETGVQTLHIAATADQLEAAPGFQTLVAARAEAEAQRLETTAPTMTDPATAVPQ